MPSLFLRNIIRDVDKVLRCHITDEGKDKFVIYTNGNGGKLVKEYLESEFGITPQYIIDNKVYDGNEILSIEQAKKRDNTGVYFLICSWHNDYYDEIRKNIYEACPEKQIIDLFSHPEEKVLPTKEEICQVLSFIDTLL